jgi:prevent-host-death family protein
MTVRQANQNFSQVVAAAERGETIVITKNGVPVAKIAPQPADRTQDPEWRSAFAALKKSLESKPATGYLKLECDSLSGISRHCEEP